MSIHQLTIKVPAAAALAALVLAGCSDASADRAGGEAVTSRVLTFAQPNHDPSPSLMLWAEEVKKASEGTLEIEFQNLWHDGELDYEAQTITDVADGEVDMAWVGARAFDTVGVTSFQALIAPLLVDNHELQAAVFAAGIPDEMLGGLDDLGLVGVGALPGPLFKILGKADEYVVPDDYTGDLIGIQASELHAQVFEALGASTELMPTGADITGVDGYAQQLDSISGNHYEHVADYVTANVNLWPRPLILFANAEVYESLDESQQAALATASAAAVEASRTALDTEESDGGAFLCGSGMQFPAASDDQLAELRAALDPVYEQLAADPETSAFLDAIQAIKDDLGAPPHTVECAPAEQAAATEIDGVYTRTSTGQEFRDAIVDSGCDSPNFPDPADIPPDLVGVDKLILEDGRVQQLTSIDGGEFEPGFAGSYEVFRDRVEVADSMGRFTMQWTFDGTTLVFSDMEGGLCDDEIVWTFLPWERETADTTDLAGPPEGTYTMTLTPADAPVDCPFDPTDPTGRFEETLFTLRLDDGSVAMSVEYGGAGGRRDQGWLGSYEVFRDRIELTDSGGTMTARWSFEDGELVFSDMQDVPACGDILVWATHPWSLVEE